ncbi:unnamed protein product [Rhizophagus irregularis]|nr:unnamed protein product [Rhizophagus irregularis]CAB5359298.1 unnamed protein product [Rhizophagus irregularis]
MICAEFGTEKALSIKKIGGTDGKLMIPCLLLAKELICSKSFLVPRNKSTGNRYCRWYYLLKILKVPKKLLFIYYQAKLE